MEKVQVQYSLGVICKHKGSYLLHKASNAAVWRVAKGHYETKDTYNVEPYKQMKVSIIDTHFEYQMEQGPALIITAIRELAEETGFVLPCNYLKNILAERYREQGELRLVKEGQVLAAQQTPYQYFNSRKKMMIEKRLTFFLAELRETEPVLKTKDKIQWVTAEQLDKLIAEGKFEAELVPVLRSLQGAQTKLQEQPSIE